MEKLKIKDQLFGIESIGKPQENLLEIVFPTEIAGLALSDSMELLTDGGETCATFAGFTTVYKQNGKTLTLSNDGTVYTEPEETEPIKLTDEQKAENEKQEKIRELESQIANIDAEFKTLDYIGIKIATGRATIDDYKPEIAKMTELADKKNELETELAELKGEQ